ncbi:MAG: hypothetical protein KGS72_25900 [Cyanobacteria bacterium REEB67]|nr:hypothetical protein [Cyanobacteria bacterium REEB67]
MMWRYFKFAPDRHSAAIIYRIPANGKNISKQNDADVHRFEADGQWHVTGSLTLRMQAMEGYFSEESDEINEAEAIERMAQTVAEGKPA